MSYPSCIKVPVSKNEMKSENDSLFSSDTENNSQIYEELISIANQVFGHGKWSHAVTSQTVDFVEYVMGKYHIGCAAFVKVQLPDGTYHEEMGYTNVESASKGIAVYSARVSSITSAMRKALLCFGGIIKDRISEIAMPTNKRKIAKIDNNTVENLSEKIRKDVSKSSKLTSSSPPPTSSSSSMISAPSPAVKRPKSPLTVEEKIQPKNAEPISSAVIRKEAVETEPAVNSKPTPVVNSPQHTKLPASRINSTENGGTRSMTEEELRLERKRRQREKQEEFRRLMKEKEAKEAKDSNGKDKIQCKF